MSCLTHQSFVSTRINETSIFLLINVFFSVVVSLKYVRIERFSSWKDDDIFHRIDLIKDLLDTVECRSDKRFAGYC